MTVASEDRFFASRWVRVPRHVRELPSDSPLPAGFRAAGVACGIKPSGALDLGLLICDSSDSASAARFGVSATPAAPVLLCQQRCRLDALRAVIVNSGNANAATGRAGLDAAARTQGAASVVAGVDERHVAVASTGIIGVPLPADAILGGLRAAGAALRGDGAVDFARSIRTTDATDKHGAVAVQLSAGTVRLSAQAKGAGMISPRFATLLCFVECDAALSARSADRLLGAAIGASFDLISVDGQLSTNDTVLLLASGASGVVVEEGGADEALLGEALDALLLELALRIVADGEGAERVGRVIVRAGTHEDADAAARSVANSPLVKAALNGGDPNWGRIVQAVGAALSGGLPVEPDIRIEGVPVCIGGASVQYDRAALEAAVQRSEVEYEVDLPGGDAVAQVYFSDLSHGYVTINAEYTT